MSFLNPTYLWALFGLLIPIAIHLWSKKEGKTIKVGSIKLLLEEDSKQSSSIQLNELLLLFMRLLAITLVVFIMAEPQIKKETLNTSQTYIIEPSLLKNENIAILIDSLKSESNVLLLKDNLPEFTNDISVTSHYEIPNYWQLAKDIEKLKTDSVIVFTSALASGLAGKRPTIGKPINWIILDSEGSSDQIIEARLHNDEIQLLSVNSNSENITFKKENTSISNSIIKINPSKDSITFTQNGTQVKLNLLKEDPLEVLLFYKKEFINEATYIEAGLKAISKHIKRSINIIKTEDSTAIDLSMHQRIVWLSNQNKIIPHIRTLYYKNDAQANAIIEKGVTKDDFYITKPLNTENIIAEGFSIALLSWLNLHPNLEKKIKPLDKRTITKAELLPIYKSSNADNSYINIISITKWLWLILALLLVTERVLAYSRKQ